MRTVYRAASRARAVLRDSERLLQTYCMVVLAVFALGFMLIELKPLLLPLCFALFISLLYAPLIDTLTCRSQPACMGRNLPCRTGAKRRMSIIGDDEQIAPNCWNSFVSSAVDMVGIGKIPKALAILFAICSAFAALGLVGWVVSDAVQELLERKDEYEQRFDEVLQNFVVWAGHAGVNITTTQVKSELEDVLVNTIAVGAAEGMADFLAQTLLMLVFLIFILFMRSSRSPVNPVDLRTNPWAAVKFKAQEKVQRYILVKTFISMGTGILVGFMLGLLGAPLPTVFGMLAFLLNFVPSIGSWIATFLPVPVILFDPKQTVSTALLAILLPGAVQVIIGDFIEPHFLGRLCQVSPLVVLVSLMLFGYLWGIGGMVLALPITIVIKLVCKQIPHAIPRYIAGMIYGDLTKYKRQLDRQLARLQVASPRKSQRGMGTHSFVVHTPVPSNPYHTDDESEGGDELAVTVATDAQLSHIVLHDDDDDDDSPPTSRRARRRRAPLDTPEANGGSDVGTDASRFSDDPPTKRMPRAASFLGGSYNSSTEDLRRLDPAAFESVSNRGGPLPERATAHLSPGSHRVTFAPSRQPSTSTPAMLPLSTTRKSHRRNVLSEGVMASPNTRGSHESGPRRRNASNRASATGSYHARGSHRPSVRVPTGADTSPRPPVLSSPPRPRRDSGAGGTPRTHGHAHGAVVPPLASDGSPRRMNGGVASEDDVGSAPDSPQTAHLTLDVDTGPHTTTDL